MNQSLQSQSIIGLYEAEEHDAIVNEVASRDGSNIDVVFIASQHAFLVCEPGEYAIIGVALRVHQVVYGINCNYRMVRVRTPTAQVEALLFIALLQVNLMLQDYPEQKVPCIIHAHEKYCRAKVDAQIRILISRVLKYVLLLGIYKCNRIDLAGREHFDSKFEKPMVPIIPYDLANGVSHFIQIFNDYIQIY